MGPNLIPNIVAIFLFLVALFVSLRSFYVYAATRNPRLFILGLSMAIISLTAAADFASSNITSITLNTDWFLYIGQAVSLLFIFLSFLRNSEEYFQSLMRVHIIASVVLIALLLLAPTLPAFPDTALKAVLSGSRCVISFGIFYCYASAFMTKQTRFGLLMTISFALIGFGYLMIVQQYFVAGPQIFDNVGDILRIFGFLALLIAILAG